jgi:hypothetical protein
MKTLVLSILIISALSLRAQYVPMDIPLVKNGISLRNAWAGGLNLPQFSEVDLNNDGIKDLVAYDREGHVASTFINNGTTGVVDYDYAPAYMKRLPDANSLNFMLLRDYNCDGIEDVFVYNSVYQQGLSLAVWEGSYDANDTIEYTLITDKLVYYLKDGNPFEHRIAVTNADLPVIDDIDGDGDLDILSFNIFNSSFINHLHWYRNMSVENGRGCDSLEYVLETACWGLFEERGDSNRVGMSPSVDSCYNNQYFDVMRQAANPNVTSSVREVVTNHRSPRDPGASLALFNFNGDTIPDMIIAGIDFRTANVLSGVEINDTILITTQNNFYPLYDKSIDIYTYPSMFFLDVNNDGKKDMLAAPSTISPGAAVMDSVAWYYQNTGSNANMLFDFQQKDFLVGEMLDVGQDAYPVLFDHNGDGLMDLLIGGYGRCQDGGAYEYGMTLLENTGTLSSPSFEYITNDYARTDSLQMNGLYPTMGDIDGDGDVDMICGMQNGTLSYFENKGGVGNPAVWASPIASFYGINVGGVSAPQLVDLDRDLDLDLVIGNRNATLSYYENVGTATNPIFNSSPVTNTLGGYTNSLYSANFRPFVYDNNGSYELFISQWVGGNVIQLGNIDGNILGTYDTLSENYNDFYQGWNTSFSMADLNNDNKLDYIVGTSRGGVLLLEEKDTLVTTIKIETAQKVVHLYPNPAKEVLNINFLTPNTETLHLTVYNALGQIVLQKTTSSTRQQHQLNISNLAAGVLFLEIQTDDYREVLRFVKQ